MPVYMTVNIYDTKSYSRRRAHYGQSHTHPFQDAKNKVTFGPLIKSKRAAEMPRVLKDSTKVL